jgi:NAD(P)-dependent dehydrogenase (short-subunit alcohol dehydrogenase family)
MENGMNATTGEKVLVEQRALVTGANSGIGAAVARELARAGRQGSHQLTLCAASRTAPFALRHDLIQGDD